MFRLGFFLSAACVVLAGLWTCTASAEEAGGAADAKQPSVHWTYLDARYVYADVGSADGPFDQGNGLGLGFSVEAFKHFQLEASYKWVAIEDRHGVDAPRTTDLFVGAGGHYTLFRATDAYLELGYAYAEEDFDGDADENDGFAMRGGVRALLTKNIELTAGGEYADLDGEDRGTGRFGAIYHLDDVFGLAANFDYDSDEVFTFSTGLRFEFGRKAD